MKLITNVTVQKIRVIADYQRKENNQLFIAILKAVYENDYFITIEEIKNRLSGTTLNTRMWKNIFNRLILQNYFIEKQRENEEYVTEVRLFGMSLGNHEQFINGYELTDFGVEAAEQNIFFKQMKGELEIWILKDKIDWFPFQIVKIEETSNSYDKLKNGHNSKQFKFPFEKILDLKKASYRFERIEDKCEILDTKEIVLTIDVNENYGEVNIEDLSFSKNELSKSILQQNFLIQQFEKKYQKRNQIVRISFDENIQFLRRITILRPTIGEVVFNKINLNNINFMAKTEAEAKKWRLAWMRENIREYIFEQDEFEQLADKIWQQFKPYYELPLLTISDVEKYLQEDTTENFYHLMKIQAPQLLTY